MPFPFAAEKSPFLLERREIITWFGRYWDRSLGLGGFVLFLLECLSFTFIFAFSLFRLL
jgi:hypothetical protein